MLLMLLDVCYSYTWYIMRQFFAHMCCITQENDRRRLHPWCIFERKTESTLESLGCKPCEPVNHQQEIFFQMGVVVATLNREVEHFFQICSLTLQVSYAFVQKSWPENQPTKLSPCRPSEFWRFQTQGQGESGDSKFVMIGVWGETPWRFCFQLWKKRENLDFLPQIVFGEITSLRVQFQSCQLNLCEQKSRNPVGHLWLTRHVLKNAGFFRHLKENGVDDPILFESYLQSLPCFK